jgi:hypothetical protein
MAHAFKMIYSMTGSGKKRSKERFETILEPLHAILQVGFLSFYPVGTKLAIKGNMLIIQPPDYSQSMSRWYNSDTQDDLCYLFNVFTRFNKYYAFLTTDVPELYSLLISNAVRGLEKLIRTYSDTNRPHILHTLNMYKQIAINKLEYNHGHGHTVSVSVSVSGMELLPTPPLTGGELASMEGGNPSVGTGSGSGSGSGGSSIDGIFCKIVEKYSKRDLTIIYNVLLTLATITSDAGGASDGNRDDYLHYINGVNQILYPVNVSIKKWIDENIVF